MTLETRREFLLRVGAAATAPLLTRHAAAAAAGTSSTTAGTRHHLLAPPGAAKPRAIPLIDFHVHLFGVGDGGSGCHVSKNQQGHFSTWALRQLLGLGESPGLDERYVKALIEQLTASSIDRAVLLAQDARYDGGGLRDLEHTPFYVPNEYLFDVVERRPDLFIPCVSINPKRRDAMEELDRCAARGAKVLKIHPPIQDVDPGEERFRPFYRKCREHGILVMVHTGTEHAAEIVHHRYCDPRRLAPLLEEGCTVIAAHAGFGADFDPEDFFDGLLEMIRRFPRLYCDTANLAATHRRGNLRRLLAAPEALARALHASDFPFPSNPAAFADRIPADRYEKLLFEPNGFERDYQLKVALGMPPEVFGRGARLLGLAPAAGS